MGFGHDEGVVIGTVTDILAPQREGAPDVMIVHDASNEKYPNDVACEFTSKHASKLEGVGMGDYVKVVGSIRSKEWNGRWFTNFVCYSLTKMSAPAARPPAGKQQHREVKGTDDDIPF